ncbi:MAG: hypothetical protein A2X08_16360 [Bacteroidetes bacterium GWA2_32_17]|nr:MAG: hypothetical protein A2X08_16360 [Bacteroidetes bacterium GWA2_32_17]
MCISNLNSYFEIFAALNLAYAGSSLFRGALDNDILKINNIIISVTKKVKELKSLFTIISLESYKDPIKQKVNDIHNKFKDNIHKITVKERFLRKFTEGFKSMFLITSLYCMFMIILGGFEQFYLNKYPWITNFCITILQIVFVFNLFVFIRSFTPFFLKKIPPFISVLFILIPFLVVTVLNYYRPLCAYKFHLIQEQYNYLFTLIVAISPYLFHFLRVMIHRYYYKNRVSILKKKCNKELNKITELTSWLLFPMDK